MARHKEEKPHVVVVYKKTPKGKYYINIFPNILVDDIINNKKRKKLIPDNYIIEDIGIGLSFVELYKNIHNARVC